MKILVAIFLVILVALVITLSYSMDETTLTAEEQEQIYEACQECHRDPDELYDENDIHRIHKYAECMKCHVGTSGLESADNAHDILQWVGIGVMVAVVAGLGVNFTVARKKLRPYEGSNG